MKYLRPASSRVQATKLSLHPPVPHCLATGIRIRSGPTHSSQELSQPV
jgi:hypothetical protein